MGWAKYDEDIREIVEERRDSYAYYHRYNYTPSSRQPYQKSAAYVGTSDYNKSSNKYVPAITSV